MANAWLIWVRRFDMKPEPQIAREYIPASLKALIVAKHDLTPEEVSLSVDVLAARYPAPKVAS